MQGVKSSTLEIANLALLTLCMEFEKFGGQLFSFEVPLLDFFRNVGSVSSKSIITLAHCARLWYWKKTETFKLVFSHVYSGIHTHEAEEHFWWATTQACFFFLSWFIIKRVELDLHIIRRRFAYFAGRKQ